MKKERHVIDFLFDIFQQTRLIQSFTYKVKFDDFQSDFKIFYAVCRALEIIGEATKQLSKEFTDKYPNIEWSKIAKLRDIVIHHYFGLDEKVIWDICKIEIPHLHSNMKAVILLEIESITDKVIKKLTKTKLLEIISRIKIRIKKD